MEVLRAHRNDVFQVFREKGLDPSDFQWMSDKSSIVNNLNVTKLSHKDHVYYFKFDQDKEGGRRTEYFPNAEGRLFRYYRKSWNEQLEDINNWAIVLKGELCFPDYWEEIYSNIGLFDDTEKNNSHNEPFTLEEQKFIASKLTETERLLFDKYNLNDDLIKNIKADTIYLIEASKRVGRKDWKNIALSVSISIATRIGYDAVIVKEILLFLKKTVIDVPLFLT